MTVHNNLGLVAALAQGTSGCLIGTAESDRLDFKQSPYPLGTDKGKYDFCSDVAALANAQGGLILCGVKTKRRSEEILVAASELTRTCRKVITAGEAAFRTAERHAFLNIFESVNRSN